jgi:phage-related protein (TIGR01555 family)
MNSLTADSLINLASHLGDSRDKQSYSQFSQTPLDRQSLEEAYKSWLPSKIARIFPEEMVREGRTIKIADEDAKPFTDFVSAVQAMKRLKEALIWGRLFGGGAVYMVIGNEDPKKPLNIETISPSNPLVSLVTFDRYDVDTVINEDPRAPNYLRPETYTFNADKIPIHWTRVLGPFDGYKLPNRLQKGNKGWGGSEVERVSSVVLQSLSVNASVASLVHRADSITVGIKGLLQKTQSTTKTQELARRFEIAAALISNNSFFLYDMDHEVPGQLKAELSAPGGLISEMMSLVASAVGAPVSRFFGTAPKGLNATGEGDRKDWQSVVRGYQVSDLGPELRRFDEIALRSVYGKEVDFEYEWNPLEQMSDLEIAEVRSKNADTDSKNVAMGAVMPSMVSHELASRGDYANLTPEWIAEQERAEAANEDEDELQEEGFEGSDPEGEGDTGKPTDRKPPR